MSDANESRLQSRAAEFCREFDYPAELTEILDQVVDLARRRLDGLVGIVLSPSISTGDLLWQRVDGRVRFLSDVDGFVFAEASSEQVALFQQDLVAIADGCGGPLFKLDLSVNARADLERMSESFQMVETRQAGFELAGSDLLSKFPDGFDPRASRQAFLLNLWKPLSSDDPATRVQNSVRLLLDIPLLATSEEGVCRPGHRARAQWFLDRRPGRLAESPETLEAVEAALDARRNPPGSQERIERLLLPAVGATLAALDGEGALPLKPDEALVRRFSRGLPPRPFRRFAGEARTILRRRNALAPDLSWLTARKEALGGAGVWGLLQIRLGGVEPNLETAEILACYSRRPAIDVKASDFFDQARAQYTAGLIELYPSLASK